MGAELARLPLDPRVGRMILEARQREALSEVLVIASAMSVQDVRDRPLEQQQAADQAHKKFDDEKSEFMGDLKLWKWLRKRAAPARARKSTSSRTASRNSCCATTSSRRAGCVSGATSIRSCTRWWPSTAGA
jgi:ATP-dependent helicase HrpA